MRSRSLVAALVFFAFTMPFGIAAHLIGEFVGLGWHDDAEVLFSARHGYLAVIAVVTLGALVAVLAAVPRGARRMRVARLIEGLPFTGRGRAFTALSFATQFAFFTLTQLGEGCPLCSGDVLIGVVAAAVAAAFGAIVVSFGQRRFLEIALALVHYLITVFGDHVTAGDGMCRASGTTSSTRRRTPFAFRYRPPPHAAVA